MIQISYITEENIIMYVNHVGIETSFYSPPGICRVVLIDVQDKIRFEKVSIPAQKDEEINQ